MTITRSAHKAPDPAGLADMIVALGPGPEDLLVAPGVYAAYIASVESTAYSAGDLGGADEAQTWSFRVLLPRGGEALYREVATYSGEYHHMVLWTDDLLGRPYADGDGRLPNAEERAALTGRQCAIRFELSCSAPSWLLGRRDLDIVRFPGGHVSVHRGDAPGWWCNTVEGVYRPETFRNQDYAGFGYQRGRHQ